MKLLTTIFSALLIGLVGINTVSAQVDCGCTNCPVAITDNGNFNANIFLQNTGPNILGGDNCLQSVCFTVDHTWIGDLDFSLTAPDGTCYIIMGDANNQPGGCGSNCDDINICIQVGTGSPAGTGATEYNSLTPGGGNCVNGTYTIATGVTNSGAGTACNNSTNNLNAFNNGTGTVSGMWTLTIGDNCSLDTGSLLDWELNFCDESGIDCSSTPLCLIDNFTANISACAPATGTYGVTGTVEFSTPPGSGSLVIEDCDGTIHVIDTYPFPGSGVVNYSLTGLAADGQPCDLTAYFTADAACQLGPLNYTAPTCPCNFSFMSTNISACNPADNTFEITGSLEFESPPATGTLTVTDCNGNAQVFNPPFVSPINYALTGIDSDGTLNCSVTATFSANPACTITSLQFDYPEGCVCEADAGTYTDGIVGSSNATGPFELCFGDELDIIGNGDLTPPQFFSGIGATYDPGVWLAVYDCPPVFGPPTDINTDPCLLGIASTNDQAWTIVNNSGDGSTLYFVPITMYSMVDGVYAISINGGDWCYDMGPTYPVTFLEEITANVTQDCQAGTATATINGGMPPIDGSNYTTVPGSLSPATASFDNTTAVSGGTITISGLQDGDNFSFDVVDSKGCPVTVTGIFTGPTDASFTYPQSAYCQSAANPAPVITGVPGGNFTSTPGLSINPATGVINLAASTAGATYTVSYTSPGAPCNSVETFDITIHPNPVIVVPNQSFCAGGSVVVTASGADTYTWSPGTGLSATTGTSVTANPATTQVYNVVGTVTATGCTGNTNVTVTVNPLPTIGGTLSACVGATTQLTGSGTPAGVTPWVSSNTSVATVNGTGLVSGVSPGSTTITYTNSNGCQISQTVTINPLPAVNVADASVCSTGTLNITASGANTYTWAPATYLSATTGTTVTFTPGNTTSYTVTGTDANGCQNTDGFTVTVLPNAPIVASADVTICAGASTTISAGGGVSYNWDNGLGAGASHSVSPAATTTYTVTGTDASGCVGTDQVVVTIAPIPMVNAVPNQTVCANTATTAVTFSGSNPANVYNWTNNNASIGLGASGTGTIPSFTAINAGITPQIATITVTPTLNGCVGTPTNFTITVNPIPTVNAVPDQTVCAGSATTAVNFSGAIAGTTYNWSNSNTGIGLGASGTNTVPSVTATNPGTAPILGTITVTPTLNGCTGTPGNFTITVNPIPTVTPVADQVICANQLTTAVNFASATVGTSYSWTNTNTSIGLAASGASNIAAFNGVNAGTTPQVATITVTPTANACVGPADVFTITVNPIPVANPVADQVICANSATTAVAFGSSVAGSTYNWTNTNGAIGLATSGSGNIGSFTGTNGTGAPISGTITVTPTANGCPGTPTNFTITINPLPTAAIAGTASVCEGDAAPVITFTGANGTAPYTFTYSVNGGPNQTVVSAGATATVNVPTSPVGTYNYNLISVEDASSTTCSQAQGGTATITVNPNPVPVITGQTEYCAGNTASITTTFAYSTYNWSPNNETTPSINVTQADNPITVTVTNGFGCTGTSATYTVAENSVITTNTSVEICQGGSAVIHGVNQTNAGVYSQTYVLGTGCDSTSNVTLIVHPLPVIDGGADITVCEGQSVTLNANGAPTLVWSPSVTNGVPFVQPVGSQLYTVTGTDANGCQNTDQVNVTVNPTPTVNATTDQVVCANAATTAVNFAGTVPGTTFDWVNTNPTIGLGANGSGNIPSFNALNAGTSPQQATITVTPVANGCTGPTDAFTITVNPIPTVDPINDQILCNGENTVAVNPTGAVAGTTYSWTNTTPSIGLAANGTGSIASFTATNAGATTVVATVNVTPSALTCVGPVESFTITVSPTPSVDAVGDQTVCAGEQTTLVAFNGPVAGTTYSWVNNNPGIGLGANGTGNINPFAGVNGGSSSIQGTITVTPSANGCTGTSEQFTVTVNPLPQAVISGTSEVCLNGPAQSITFTGSNGTAPYTFTYTINGGVNQTVVSTGNTATVSVPTTTAGIYNYDLVSVEDASSTTCMQAQAGTATVTVHALPIVNAGVDQTVCEGEQVTLSGSGAVTYVWQPAVVDGVAFTPLSAATTTYTVTGTDANGCVNTDDVDVTVNPLPAINAGPDQVICIGDQVTLSGQGAGAGGAYIWTGGVIDGQAFSPGATASYTVTGTDANGCENSDDVLVTVNPLPAISAGNDLSGCESDEYILTGSGAGPGGAYVWDNGVTNGVPFYAVAGSTVYTVTGTNANGCENTDQVTITVEAPPVVSFDFNQVGNCAPVTVTFTNTSNPAGTNCVWYLDDGTVINGCGPIVHTFTTPGVYGVSLETQTLANGCVGSVYYDDIIVVDANPVAAFTASPQTTTTIDTEIFFDNNSVGATSYEWNFGDGSGISNETNPSHEYDPETGVYNITLVAISQAGCTDTVIGLIRINEALIFYVPNTFTPDQDQFNETFQPVFTSGFDPFDYTLLIFNRWGEIIFESHDASIGWNGVYGIDGAPCQDGTYTWKIEFKTTATDERQVHVGHVNLLK